MDTDRRLCFLERRLKRSQRLLCGLIVVNIVILCGAARPHLSPPSKAFDEISCRKLTVFAGETVHESPDVAWIGPDGLVFRSREEGKLLGSSLSLKSNELLMQYMQGWTKIQPRSIEVHGCKDGEHDGYVDREVLLQATGSGGKVLLADGKGRPSILMEAVNSRTNFGALSLVIPQDDSAPSERATMSIDAEGHGIVKVSDDAGSSRSLCP